MPLALSHRSAGLRPRAARPPDPDIPAAATAEPTLASVGSSADVVANAAIVLPVNQSSSGSAINFGLTQTDTGPTGIFKIANAGNSQTALLGQTNGDRQRGTRTLHSPRILDQSGGVSFAKSQ